MKQLMITVIIVCMFLSCNSSSSWVVIEGLPWVGLEYGGTSIDGINLKPTGICIDTENGQYFLVSDGDGQSFNRNTIYRLYGKVVSKVPPIPNISIPRYYFSAKKVEAIKSFTDNDLNLIKSLNDGDYKKAENLITNGADIEVRADNYETPLHLIFEQYFRNLDLKEKSETLEIAKLLLDKGANVNAKNIVGNTPLYSALWAYCYKTTELLLQRGADINNQNAKGNTPLHAFVGRERPNEEEIIQMLVKYGADIEIKNSEGLSPMEKATDKQKGILLKLKNEKPS